MGFKIAAGNEALVLVQRVSQAFAYENGERTQNRVIAEGQPVSRVSGLGLVAGNLGEVSVEVTDAVAEQAQAGQAMLATGALQAEISGGDFGSVRTKILGATGFKDLGTTGDFLGRALTLAQKGRTE